METEKGITRTIRFSEPSHVQPPAYRDRRSSCGNDRTLNPSVSGAEQSYDSFTRITGTTNPSNMHPRTKELFSGSTHEEGTVITKTITSKISKVQKDTETKGSSASKRTPQLSKNHKLVRSYKTCLLRTFLVSSITITCSDATF